MQGLVRVDSGYSKSHLQEISNIDDDDMFYVRVNVTRPWWDSEQYDFFITRSKTNIFQVSLIEVGR